MSFNANYKLLWEARIVLLVLFVHYLIIVHLGIYILGNGHNLSYVVLDSRGSMCLLLKIVEN